MPLESDNDAEREARIEAILREVKRVQNRVERLAAEGQSRAAQIASDRRDAEKDRG